MTGKRVRAVNFAEGRLKINLFLKLIFQSLLFLVIFYGNSTEKQVFPGVFGNFLNFQNLFKLTLNTQKHEIA